jgi:hypothetical protein
MKEFLRSFGAALLLASFASCPNPSVHAATVVEPGGTTDATAPALSNPAEYTVEQRLRVTPNRRARSRVPCGRPP